MYDSPISNCFLVCSSSLYYMKLIEIYFYTCTYLQIGMWQGNGIFILTKKIWIFGNSVYQRIRHRTCKNYVFI